MLVLKMAVRNLRRNKRTSLVVGIIMSVGLIFVVVALSFIQGIKTNYETLILGTIVGDVSISSVDDTFKYSDKQIASLESLDGISSAAPRLYEGCYLFNGDTFVTATCIGIDESKDEQLVSNFSRRDNELVLNYNSIAITRQLSELISAEVGDKIQIAFRSMEGQSKKMDVTVSCLYEAKSSNSAIEAWVVMRIADMREMMNMEENEISTVKVFLNDNVDLAEQKIVISEMLKEAETSYVTELWKETSAADMMRTPDVYAMILMSFASVLFVLISIGITSVLFSALLEKIGEYGVMRTLGMKREQIIFMNLLEMLILITISMVAGTLICAIIVGVVNAAEIGISSEALKFTFGGNVLTLKLKLGNCLLPISFIFILSICISIIEVRKVIKIPILDAMNDL